MKRIGILVIHGIGQQQPLQVLDNFTRGLRRVLGDGWAITHVKPGPEAPFADHTRLQNPDQTLDIFEYHWAKKTQGKTSFLAIANWILATAFTPLQRLAFNLPLLIERAQTDSKNRGKAYFWWYLTIEFLIEIRRLIYIPIVFTIIALGATQLVRSSGALARHVLEVIEQVMPSHLDWLDVSTLVLFLGGVGALIAMLYSLREQMSDYAKIVQLPGPYRRGKFWTEGTAQWTLEAPSRIWLLYLSVFMIFALGYFLAQIALGTLSWWPSSLIQGVFAQLDIEDLARLGRTIALLLAAVLIKRVFVDYLGDIPLYVTADENSEFAKTRSEILTEATDKLRWLLQQQQYDQVALAGHSLGSVIAYDAICRLRVESQTWRERQQARTAIGRETTTIRPDEFARLRNLITFGSPLNKVVYFFRTKIRPYETVRIHILNETHGFRRRGEQRSDPTIQDDPPFQPQDNAIRWLNVYSPMDPISARLVYFREVEERWRWYFPRWGIAHVRYWEDDQFYRYVADALR